MRGVSVEFTLCVQYVHMINNPALLGHLQWFLHRLHTSVPFLAQTLGQNVHEVVIFLVHSATHRDSSDLHGISASEATSKRTHSKQHIWREKTEVHPNVYSKDPVIFYTYPYKNYLMLCFLPQTNYSFFIFTDMTLRTFSEVVCKVRYKCKYMYEYIMVDI